MRQAGAVIKTSEAGKNCVARQKGVIILDEAYVDFRGGGMR